MITGALLVLTGYLLSWATLIICLVCLRMATSNVPRKARKATATAKPAPVDYNDYPAPAADD